MQATHQPPTMLIGNNEALTAALGQAGLAVSVIDVLDDAALSRLNSITGTPVSIIAEIGTVGDGDGLSFEVSTVGRTFAHLLSLLHKLMPVLGIHGGSLTLILEDAAVIPRSAVESAVRATALEALGNKHPYSVNAVFANNAASNIQAADALSFLASGEASFITGNVFQLAPDLDRHALAGRVILVTGATDGIGRNCALDLASRGANVIVSGRDLVKAQGIAQEASLQGAEAFAIQLDATDDEDWRSAIREIDKKFGRLNDIVSNVGACRLAPVGELSVEDIDLMCRSNVQSNAAALKYGIPAIAAGGGNIVLIGSVAARRATGNNAAYGASKAAIAGLVAVAAPHAAKKSIMLNTVHPGLVFNENVLRTQGKERAELLKQAIVNATPLGRTAKEAEISAAICALIERKMGLVMGGELIVDGGYSA